MRKNRLGRTALDVTELGFGTAPIGNLYTEVDGQAAAAAIDTAWQAGIRYFDTAPHYGLGLAERRLGAALSGVPRDEFVVSTKVGRLLVPNPSPTGSDMGAGFAVADRWQRVRDYSADGVRRSLEASLSRLGLDRVDIALVHDPDQFVEEAVRAAIPALIALREEGVIAAVGVGMNQWQAPMRMVRETDLDVVMLAGRWTPLDRSGLPLLDLCHEAHVAVLCAGPFNSGLLARPWPSDDAPFDYATAPPELLSRARALARRVNAFGTALPQVALQYPLRHPAVASVVAGMRSADEVRANTMGLQASIHPEVWPALDEATL